jgi:NAD(P)-dependent dehydrogenase (short-subunit alcohol dehydrogenase family)
MANLKDAMVLVTGASGNVGAAVVKAFAAQGSRVAMVDRSVDRMNDLIKNELNGDTERFQGFPADLSEAGTVEQTLSRIEEEMGIIQHAVHAVGGFAMGDPVHDGNIGVFDKMMLLNARITYLVCGKIASHMLDNGVQGSISMIIARAAQKGGQNNAAYVASKAAAKRIMQSMAAELKADKIRVNGISPSLVDTPPNREAMPDADFDKWVKPEQIGHLACFLAQNNAMTGADVEISAWS